MRPGALPRCTPEEVGVPSRAVLNCLRALCHDQTTMNGCMAARHGKVFSECWWAPYGPEMVHVNHSFGKSYTATAVGIAVGEGLVRLDEKMVDIFDQEIRERSIVPPAGVEKITVEHVLTMTNGMARMPDMRGDFIAHYFSTPLAYEPGTKFMYNSTGSCMLGAIVLKRSGQNLKEYLTPRLFEKIGIDPDAFVWRRFRDLPIDAEPGTFARTEDNLRLAMLYLNGGRWNGEQVLPESFVRAALSVHVSTADAPEQRDGLCGYGYQLWACSIPGVYRFDGGQGQFGLIWPEKDLVVAIHEGAMGPRGPQMTLEAVYETLFAALSEEPLSENPADLAALRAAERAAVLPDDPVGPAPDESFSGWYAVTAGEFDLWMSAAPPGNDDFFRLFRTPALDRPVRRFALEVTKTECRLELEGFGILIAAFDGSWQARSIPSPFERLGHYAACARMAADGSLELHIRWFNGWFETWVRFAKTDTGLRAAIRKLRLNETDNYLTYEAAATRQGGESCVAIP